MKSPLVFGAIALAGHAAAFYGQLNAGPYDTTEGNQVYQYVYLTDYNTGSTYSAYVPGGFDACSTATECEEFFEETSAGGYNFEADVWRTSDGCHNIDFLGALNSHHGYCCGSLPCDITA